MATFRESETETIALIEWHRPVVARSPAGPTRAFLRRMEPLASHEFSARCKALSRKADSDA